MAWNRIVSGTVARAVVLSGLVIGAVTLLWPGSVPREPIGFTEPAEGSRVAMSSPVDPDARFFWELPEEPPSLIPLDQIVSGGPPPDGIPAIDVPAFEPVGAASAWLAGTEPVVAVEVNGDARAYPIQILIWHEIVNDVIGGEPVAVTYCPLCNSAVVFGRRAGDLVLDFGTSGRLYNSDLVMYDRQTKSLWPQIEGRAVVGPLMGTELEVLPASMVSWDAWRAAHPDGRVLSRDTGVERPYGRNPYVGYDAPGSLPSGLFLGPVDRRLPPMTRVLAVELGGEVMAYPYGALAEDAPTAVNDAVGGTGIVAFYERGTASPLDAPDVPGGRDVGATGVFVRELDGRELTFEVRDGAFVDLETGTRWNLLGQAVAGPLEGEELEPVPHIDTFWFAWAVFQPDTGIWTP